jgi:hypothetical protein
MRFYSRTHKHYCGVDLHARSMYVCVLDGEGAVLVSKNIPAAPEPLLELIAPYREDLAVAAECMFTWYWLADLCEREGIVFVLGHALYMRAIHGGKAKNDRIDAHKIAALLRGGMLPQAYVYPKEMRATRDLMGPVERRFGSNEHEQKSANYHTISRSPNYGAYQVRIVRGRVKHSKSFAWSHYNQPAAALEWL